MKSTDRIINKNRRDFLSMLSRAGISTGLLKGSALAGGLMASRFAQAQGSAKRVVFIYTSNGSPNGMWLPNGRTLNTATKAYEGLQSICNFREVEVIDSGHGLARKCMGELRWGSDWTGDTIDQQIASVIGTTTPYPSYALGVQTKPTEVIGRKAGNFVPAQDSPEAAYRQLFGGAPPAGGGGQQLLERKKAVLDLNRNALTSLRTKLGTFERETLERHIDAINSIEQRLEDSSKIELPAGCSSPAWNANRYDTRSPLPSGDLGVFGHQAELQCDIIAAAMECGLTNVMTLQLGTDQAEWYGHDTQFRGDLHGSCHAAPASANAEMTNYQSRIVAYMIRKLMDKNDPAVPGTKLIDNTVVVQVTDMGDGRDHTAGNGPNMVATRMRGFKQGTVTSGGNNYHVLEAVVEGMGLGQFKGTGQNTHKIWPSGGGRVATDILA